MNEGAGRVAVVTGASSGLGLEIARGLVKRGWSVAALSRNAEKLAHLGSVMGECFEPHTVDVADHDRVAQVFDKIRERHNIVDLLVNNAALFKMAPYGKCTVADINGIVDTNLKGTMYCSHSVLPLLRRPGGRIVNIASVAATHGIANQAIYCASKYGVDGFAEALGQELEADGIGITTICPGGIDTTLWNGLNPYPGDSSKLLKAEDVAGVVQYITELPARVMCKKIVIFPNSEWH